MVHFTPDANSFIYFAYGSNMFSERLKAMNRAPGAVAVGPALLQNYALSWNKPSVDGSGKCNVIIAPGEIVFGVLYRIPNAQRAALDKAEGLGSGYQREEVIVEHAGTQILAIAYTAKKVKAKLKIYDCYKAHVLRGACEFSLPSEYVSKIARITSCPCPPGHKCN